MNMEQTQQPSAEQIEASAQGPELVRPLNGRMVAGVAQGLANRFELPVWLVRGGFILLTIGGGAGALLYLLGFGLIRSEEESTTPVERLMEGQQTGKNNWIPIALMVGAALIFVGSFDFFSGEILFAAAMLTVGILMYTGHLSTPSRDKEPVETKEGVQRMSSTTIEETKKGITPDGDSPAGGAPPTRPTPAAPPPAPVAPKERSILGRLTIGVTLIALAVLAILDNIETVPIDADPRHYFALATIGLGAGLLVGAFAGRARWLIIVGAILIPALLTSPLAEIEFDSDNFDRVEIPTAFADLDENYAVEVGDLLIDLTDLPWDGQEIEIDATVDLGQLTVWVPPGVRIEGEADVDLGRVETPSREVVGLGGSSVDMSEGNGDLGTVVLDLHVDAGNIEIIRTR